MRNKIIGELEIEFDIQDKGIQTWGVDNREDKLVVNYVIPKSVLKVLLVKKEKGLKDVINDLEITNIEILNTNKDEITSKITFEFEVDEEILDLKELKKRKWVISLN